MVGFSRSLCSAGRLLFSTFLGKNLFIRKTRGWLKDVYWHPLRLVIIFGKTHASVGKTFRKNPFLVWENLFIVDFVDFVVNIGPVKFGHDDEGRKTLAQLI